MTRIFVSFIKDYAATTPNPREFWNKNYNCFYHSLRSTNTGASLDAYSTIYNREKDFVQSVQVQNGSKLIPDYPIRSTAEAFYFLRKAVNTNLAFPNHIHSLDIYGKEYYDNKFIMCFDCEKINGKIASFTGMNVKNGDQITLKMTTLTSSIADIQALNPEDCHIVLESEQVLEVKGSYVRVAD